MAPTLKLSISSQLIQTKPLDPEAFAPFGEVIQNPKNHSGSPQHIQSVTANQGTATKWLDVTQLQSSYELSGSRRKGQPVVNMFVCEPRRLEQRETSNGVRAVFPVHILERHPFTPQTFVPLGVAADDDSVQYLVIVAPTYPTQARFERDDEAEARQPPYPTDSERPRRKRSLKERLLGARPSPYPNDRDMQSNQSNPKRPGTARKGAGPPDLDDIQAFIARGDQAVTYGPGTWHAPMVALGRKPIDFVVVQYANGVALEDCQEMEIPDGIAVDVGEGGNVKARL